MVRKTYPKISNSLYCLMHLAFSCSIHKNDWGQFFGKSKPFKLVSVQNDNSKLMNIRAVSKQLGTI